MDLDIQHLKIKIMFESDPLRSIMLVRRLAVYKSGPILKLSVTHLGQYVKLRFTASNEGKQMFPHLGSLLCTRPILVLTLWISEGLTQA